MDDVHGDQVIQEIRHGQHHEVVGDVEPVPHDVPCTLLVDEPSDSAGKQGERT